jgi:hypothetical protein
VRRFVRWRSVTPRRNGPFLSEADKSRESLGASITLERGEATELEFKRLAVNQRVFHLATHGIVLADSCRSSIPDTRGVGGVAPLCGETKPAATEQADRIAKPAESDASRQRARHPSPLLGRRVLLALANANHAREHAVDENEGLLTAEEVATLDLRGVDWVVLSACQSWGREGVLGMQRAFRLAGARAMIASQWSVDDDATREWIRALYEARARAQARWRGDGGR